MAPRINYLGQNIDAPGAVQIRQPNSATGQPFDLNAAIAAFLMQQQAAQTDRLKLQGEQSFGRNLGWEGPGGLTPQSKWDQMFPQGASSLTPEARLASQGPSAMTQWAQRGQVAGVNPDTLNELMAPNPSTFQHSPGGNYMENQYGSGHSGYVGPMINSDAEQARILGLLQPSRPGAKRLGRSFGFGGTAAPGFSM